MHIDAVGPSRDYFPGMPSIAVLCKTHRMVRQEDTEEVFRRMNMAPEQVIVRDLYYDRVYEIRDIAEGPFTLSREGDSLVISGLDKRTKSAARFLIDPEGVVYVNNDSFKAWTALSFSGVRIYILDK